MPQTGYSGSVSLSTHDKRRPRKHPKWQLRYRTPERPGGSESILGPAWIDADLWRSKHQVRHLRSRPAKGFLTEAMAHTAAEAFMLEVENAKPQDRRTLDEALQAFVQQKRREQKDASTIASYESCARVLAARLWKGKTLGEHPLDAITVRDIQTIQNAMMDENRSASTLNHYHHMIRGAFGADAPQAKAWKRIVNKTSNSGRIHFYTPAQVRTLLEHVALWWEAAWWTIAAQAGLRRSEVIALRRVDVDFASRTLHVIMGYTTEGGMSDTKGHRVRSLPMTNDIVRVLTPLIANKPLYDEQGEALLVFSRDGQGIWPMDPDSATKRFERTRKSAGLPKITLHELRHTFGTQAMASGKIDIYTLQRLMGHEDITTTQKYLHFAPKHELGQTLSLIWEEEPETTEEVEVAPIRELAESLTPPA